MYALAGVLAMLGGLAGAALHAVNASAGRSGEASFWLMQVAAALGYGLLTLVLRRQATTALRLTVAGIGLGAAASLLAGEWSSADPGSTWMLWLGSWSWAPGYIAIIALLPLLLPDGTLVSSRWRPAAWLGALSVVLAGVFWALWPYEDQDYPGALEGATNPVGLDAVSDPLVSATIDVLLIAAVLVAAASVVVRWRRSVGVERQQLKWVLLGVLSTVALAALARLVPMPFGEVVAALAMLPLPLAVAVAVLRHGLWDVEVVFARALVYALVAALAVGLYVGTVAVVGEVAEDDSGRVSLVAVALLAPLLLPLHGALQRRVNRWVHGDEEEPWQELARLGERLGTVADPDEMVARVLPDVLGRVRRALRARTVRLRLVDGSGLVEGVPVAGGMAADETVDAAVDAAPVPRQATTPVTVPLVYAGETLGTLEVTRDGGFGATERDLLDRWAGQAAVAVHTVLLAREARRSREVVVMTREEERRRLRRDLHDGVGPSLAALALQVETARDLAAEDPEAAAGLLTTLAPRINAVVADVRSLVHELRPPTLDELGLAGATRELAARLSGSVRVDVDGDLGALPAAVEVAAYRITGEAVTNAVRHSGADSIRVRLGRVDDTLVVEVADDGSGLADGHRPGVGLGSMRLRAEELGGTMAVESGGRGTVVTARLPLEDQLAPTPAGGAR